MYSPSRSQGSYYSLIQAKGRNSPAHLYTSHAFTTTTTVPAEEIEVVLTPHRFNRIVLDQMEIYAKRIQRAWRRFRDRGAGQVIQSRARNDRAWGRFYDVAHNAAALAIQRVWRGGKVRDVVTSQLAERYEKLKQHPTQCAIIIQKTWRGYLTRKRLVPYIAQFLDEMEVKQQVSAVKIQKVIRGYLARTLATAKRARIQKMSSNIKSSAAIEIQRAWKGYCCRKDYPELLVAHHTAVYFRRHSAAGVIQRNIRGFLGRKKALWRAFDTAQAIVKKLHQASTVIECAYRCRLAVKRVHFYRAHRAAAQIQRTWKGWRTRHSHPTLLRHSLVPSVRVVQTFARAFQAWKLAMTKRRLRSVSLSKLAMDVRRYTQQMDIRLQEMKVVKSNLWRQTRESLAEQTNFDTMGQRYQEYEELHARLVVMDQEDRERNSLYRFHWWWKVEHDNATRIQARWRGVLQRAHVIKLHTFATRIQRWILPLLKRYQRRYNRDSVLSIATASSGGSRPPSAPSFQNAGGSSPSPNPAGSARPSPKGRYRPGAFNRGGAAAPVAVAASKPTPAPEQRKALGGRKTSLSTTLPPTAVGRKPTNEASSSQRRDSANRLPPIPSSGQRSVRQEAGPPQGFLREDPGGALYWDGTRNLTDNEKVEVANLLKRAPRPRTVSLPNIKSHGGYFGNSPPAGPMPMVPPTGP